MQHSRLSLVLYFAEQCTEANGLLCLSNKSFYSCLEGDKICDGVTDCLSGEDEEECVDERLYPYGDIQGDTNILDESFNPLTTTNRRKRGILPSGMKFLACEQITVNGRIGAQFGDRRHNNLFVSLFLFIKVI